MLLLVSILKLNCKGCNTFYVKCVNIKLLQNHEYLIRKHTFQNKNVKGYNVFIDIL